MVVFKSKREIDLPRLDLLSLLFDSDWCLALEETKIHVQAANPSNSITKAESRGLLKQVAYVLRHRFGIGASGAGKDVVLTVLSGSPFAPVFFYGVVAAGGIFSGASTEYRVEELTRQIEDGAVTLLVCSPECEAQVVQAADACGIARDRVLILDSTIPHSWKLISVADRSDVLERSRGKMLEWQRITDQRRLEEVTTCLLYSSGTTGLPKGIRISHWSLVANNVCTMDPARRYQALCKREGREFTFNTIAHLPMSNIAGISLYSTNPFYMGGTTWWMEKYDFDSFLEYHRRYRPAYQFSVPPVWLRIAKSDKVTDHFDALQVAVTGAAPIGDDVVREVRKKLGRGRAHMAQTWGTTETTGVIAATDWPAYAKDGTWSVGELCPNVTLRVVDEDGQDLAEGQPGEMLVGGPILAQAYHNRPQATLESFQDGFYRTGDIGTYKDGHVRIVDRKKELIKYKGAQVAPAELEALLTSHPRIADAAVIGLWDDQQQTEVPRAYVVSRLQPGGEPITAQEVADFVKRNAASYKQLRGGVFFVNEIPKSASGKILRKELRSKARLPSSPVQAKL
ncbi:uncharacterized protein PV07_07022 [Cladophialophora immunda]|uniref:Uncharacterized protein n=1 Tax=Cladophialophora immunda TaxID=569365 RepID=A0A0D2C7Z1_9EURO|nr:uncharacterized protein PV07_07022 [Cladophialophora immunda]KIW27268.1 hypothetical protein PV07_07022 [Cladophialophora immunda]OQV05883.1 hypothetical protein CLAIMM_10539 [Cladophialophora immunda]